MKSRERNTAFFKQGDLKDEAGNGETSGGMLNIFKNARATGKLNLSARSLTVIPDEVFMLGTSLQEGEKFWELNPLSRLDLSSNVLRHLPSGKFELLQSDLIYLKLKDNKLDSLPTDLFACNLLQHLDLSANALTELNKFVGELNQLKELFASDNKLETLPTSLNSCRNLQLLELQNNQLSRIPPESLSLPQLLRLDLSSNKLSIIPINICELRSLETLDISKNRLENIPDLSQLKSLKFLNASNNKITIMPLLPIHGKLDRIYFGENSLKEICMTSVLNSAESITEFLIQGNQLAECPNDIYLLRNLKVLDLSNNCLTNLPPSLGYMTFLQKILLEGNSIRTIKRTLLSSPVAEELKTFLRTRGPPPKSEKTGDSKLDAEEDFSEGWNIGSDAHTSAELARQLQWRVRDCSGNGLDFTSLGITSQSIKTVFEAIKSSHTFQSLLSINLSSNSMTIFPTELANLPALQKIILSGNMLGANTSDGSKNVKVVFPIGLANLDISNNKIDSDYLDDIICSLNRQGILLSVLLCSGNRLTDIPRSITEQIHLRELRVSYNQINTLKGLRIFYLKRLEILDLSNNKIPRLDEIFPPSLSTLLLSNNGISELPVHLTGLTALQSLQLTGNPIKSIRPEIISQGVEAIFNVLRHRASSGTGTPGIRVGGPTDPSMTRQGQVQGQVPDKEGGKEGGTREVARRAPTKSIARVPAVEKSGWNDDSSTGHLEGQINEGSLDLDSRHANTQHSDMSTAQSTYADSRSVQRDSTVTQSNRSSSLPLHRQSQNSHDSRTIPLNANDQKMKSEISKLENELENSSNSSKKMQIRREITSMKAKLGVRE